MTIENAPAGAGTPDRGNVKGLGGLAMTDYQDNPDTTAKARYVQQGRDVIDTEGNRRASFVSEESARESAEWMNGGTARIDNYVWETVPARTVGTIDEQARDLGVKPSALIPDDSTEEDRGARYVAEHPEISAAVPHWTDELLIDFDEHDPDTVPFSARRTHGLVELHASGEHHDGVATIDPGSAFALWFPADVHTEDTPHDLAEYARRVAADLMVAAALLDGDAR